MAAPSSPSGAAPRPPPPGLAALQSRLPAGARVRAGAADDLERLIAFANRFARPAQRQSLALARRFEAMNPQPNRLSLLVEDGDGELVAVGQTSDGGVFARKDGTFRVSLRVSPGWRRRGVGSALLEALEAHAQAQGAARHSGSIRGDEPEGLAFAERHGYEEFHRRFDSYVDLQTFDPAGFEDPAAVAARSGVRVVSYDALEAEHATSPEARVAFQRHVYDVFTAVSRDIPSPDAGGQQFPPFEAVREMYFEGDSFHRPSSILAVRGDRVVGLTITNLNDEQVAYTILTGVVEKERGQGLATAMKLRAIRELQARGARLYGTTNDEGNAPMRGINARLGYRPDPPIVEVAKRLR